MGRLEIAQIEAKNYEAQRKLQIAKIISEARRESLFKAKSIGTSSEDILVIAEKYYQYLIKDVDLEI